MTLLQIRTLVSDWVDDPNMTYFTQSILNLRINLACKQLQKHLLTANQYYYSKCVVTQSVIGQQDYSVPSDFMEIVRLCRLTQGSGVTANTLQIYPITENQQNLIYATQGLPTHYWFQKNSLMLWPVPNQLFTIRMTYSYLIADLVSDSDIPDAPTYFHEYIAILAARDCFLKDGRDITPIKDKLEEYKVSIKEIAEQRQKDYAHTVVETGWSWNW